MTLEPGDLKTEDGSWDGQLNRTNDDRKLFGKYFAAILPLFPSLRLQTCFRLIAQFS
jgi:hypothetical protein